MKSDECAPKFRLNFVIIIMVVILIFMFFGAGVSLYLEGQFKHQRLIDAGNLIERERYENRQMILQLMKRVQILEKKIK